MYFEHFQFQASGKTPKSLFILISTIALLSILGAILAKPFLIYFQTLGPIHWMSLSLEGIQSFYFWQLFTHALMESPDQLEMTFSFGIHLFFSLYLFWLASQRLLHSFSEKEFYTFYFSSILFTGLIGLISIYQFSLKSSPASISSSLTALFVLWSMLDHQLNILLLLTFPIQLKWIIFSLQSLLLLSYLSSGNIYLFSQTLGAIVYAYIYGLIILKLQSPFEKLQSLDQSIICLFQRIKSFSLNRLPFQLNPQKAAKIYDIQTGKAISSEAHMNATLEKIKEKGTGSLTWEERKNIRKTSQEMKADKKNPSDQDFY